MDGSASIKEIDLTPKQGGRSSERLSRNFEVRGENGEHFCKKFSIFSRKIRQRNLLRGEMGLEVGVCW